MGALFKVPRLVDLDGLSVEVTTTDEPGVVSVTAWANDGAVVTVIWDEIAASVHVRWVEDGVERWRLDRELATKVSVREERGRVEFWIWSGMDGFRGQLVVSVAERVTVTDVFLQG
ncbi:hypothetical protein OG474_11390 [Kribbella sp. NBC_01505]|uniref:hypothetical protein n=1 Tax=Kribbella sp. NBC_01505 TaxID=2903580 RepID=UPI003868E6EE